MAPDLGLVPHPAQREADEVAAGRLGQRLAQAGLADAGRADEAEDRPLHLVDALLDGEILDDPLLDLLEAVVVGIEHVLRQLDVLPDLGALLPGDGQHPVQIVAHHGRLGRHRAHGPELLQLGHRLVAGFLAELGLLDPILELGRLVLAVLELAQLLLDRLHLLVEIVLALGLLHLPLDARADALLDLENADLALHEAVEPLQPLAQGRRLEQILLVGDLQGEMRRHRVGELARIVDLRERDQNLGRHLLVELHILLELRDHGAGQRLDLAHVGRRVLQHAGGDLEEAGIVDEAGDVGAGRALDQDLDRAVGQLEQLQHAGDGADAIDVVRTWIVLARVLLRDQQDLLVLLHHLLERRDRLLATDEEGHDHVRKDDNVAQG